MSDEQLKSNSENCFLLLNVSYKTNIRSTSVTGELYVKSLICFKVFWKIWHLSHHLHDFLYTTAWKHVYSMNYQWRLEWLINLFHSHCRKINNMEVFKAVNVTLFTFYSKSFLLTSLLGNMPCQLFYQLEHAHYFSMEFTVNRNTWNTLPLITIAVTIFLLLKKQLICS